MANQHQAQHADSTHQAGQHQGDQHKGDPKGDPKSAIPFVVTVTPEQYDARMKQAAAAPKDAPPRPQMNVGDTATAKVSFTDEAGGAINIASSTWTSMTSAVTIVPDDKDPTTANLTAAGPGRAPIKVDITTDTGAVAEAATEVMVIQPGTPTAGQIDVTVTPAKKAK